MFLSSCDDTVIVKNPQSYTTVDMLLKAKLDTVTYKVLFLDDNKQMLVLKDNLVIAKGYDDSTGYLIAMLLGAVLGIVFTLILLKEL
jgi:hypothetical protein